MKRTTVAIFLWVLILSGINVAGLIPDWLLYLVTSGSILWILVREEIAP